MYYILNETNQIIAADDNLLKLCGVSHIDQLSLNIALGDTKFDLSEENIMINNDQTFAVSKTPLSSLLGQITLVDIQLEEEKTVEEDLSALTLEDTVEESIAPLDSESDLVSAESETKDMSEETEIAIDDSELFDLTLEEDETENALESAEDTLNIIPEDTEILDLGLDEAEIETEKTEDTLSVTPEDTEILDLGLDEAESKTEKAEDSLNVIPEDTEILDLGLPVKEDEVAMDKSVSEEEDTSEILVDIDKVCQKIGISHEDYDTFLNEYIDTALGLEKDLQSTDTATRSNAVATLSHLGEVLQLPVVGEIITKIDTVPEHELKGTVESFYATLSRITTSPASQAEPEVAEPTLVEPELAAPEVAQGDIEEVKPEATVSEKGFGTISFDDVKPIHFDFQLEEAASDLSLPVELIEEFVNDFIEQCHIETEKMLKAYEEGDLDTIQKIGHLLKGASSNLRINPLSDTLYKIQFCEDSSQLEALIKDYWGHFLSFEIQINALAK